MRALLRTSLLSVLRAPVAFLPTPWHLSAVPGGRGRGAFFFFFCSSGGPLHGGGQPRGCPYPSLNPCLGGPLHGGGRPRGRWQVDAHGPAPGRGGGRGRGGGGPVRAPPLAVFEREVAAGSASPARLSPEERCRVLRVCRSCPSRRSGCRAACGRPSRGTTGHSHGSTSCGTASRGRSCCCVGAGSGCGVGEGSLHRVDGPRVEAQLQHV